MEMDMDISWCLACSRRTRDPNNPYCSESCRLSDAEPSTPLNERQLITSPLPPNFVPLPPSPNVSRKSSDRRPSRRVAPNSEVRPSLSPLVTRPAPSTGVIHDLNQQQQQRTARDRRALSFPAEREPCPEEEESNPLPFVRKTKPVNGVSRSFKRRSSQMSPELTRLTMTTGQVTPSTPTTPAVETATFYSTSDSEDGGSNGQRSPALTSTQLHPAPPMPLTRMNGSSNTSFHRDNGANVASSLSAKLPGPPTLEARNRSNPVTRMSSSSSRSREDIISWARGVDARHRTDDGTPVDTATIRRSRGRRPEAFANLVPPSTESLDEPVTSTTPKSAGPLSALSMTFGPVMNAFRSVSGGTAPAPTAPVQNPVPQSSALGLQAVPAPAEVSIVDVVVGTKSDCQSAMDPSTPSLSTMSLSDAVDPSTTTDMYDTATDDFSIVSSVSRPPIYTAPSTHNPLPQQFRRANKAALPLRPTIQSTASALWNFSTYIRSLTPFAAPTTPKPKPSSTEPTPQPIEDTPVSESVLLTPDSAVQATSPVPTTVGRPESPDFSMQPEQLVRSVPMDIAIAPGSKALEVIQERQREREMLDNMPRSRSRTRIMASRSPSVEAQIGRNHHQQQHARQVSYDADCSEVGGGAGDERGRRGRSRGRAPRGERPPRTQPVTPPEPVAKAAPVVEEPERGRRRDRGAESRDRSWSAARGRRSRSRTMRAY